MGDKLTKIPDEDEIYIKIPACFGIISQLGSWQDKNKGTSTQQLIKKLNIFKEICEDEQFPPYSDLIEQKLSLCKDILAETRNDTTSHWNWPIIDFILNQPENMYFAFLEQLKNPISMEPDVSLFLNELQAVSDGRQV